ncbi:hypothetical protein M0638_21890 [Roseomonas sp. NAR14]|uniref:Uncharacterized protein n=1 Tax=Roseomonas acroporae TaxID=2937791 RepID=A0A9X1YC74_9PROT|nr:hypothetical protein [Roseomonas acroporae]MCK8787030.1 hypothetical protein [Roseomonas acroporae]
MRRITLDERAAQLQRKREAGLSPPSPELLRNSGNRRTVAKRRLLERIAAVSAKRGADPVT